MTEPQTTGRSRGGCRRDAEQGADLVELFPAWETLPFERVSPDVATMGRRLRLLWQLARVRGRATETRPTVVVAPIKARSPAAGALADGGPSGRGGQKGQQVSVDELVDRLVAMGYRRESIVEHRGELAVRGGIVDVFPSTADEPVRIDLWGDEVDRLTRFDVADQRSIDDLARVELFGCRELVPDEAMRKRAAASGGHRALGPPPVGAAGRRLTVRRDGVLAPLAGGRRRSLVTDLLGDDALVVLVEPRRVRDRAGELLDEEAALAEALAIDLGTGGR